MFGTRSAKAMIRLTNTQSVEAEVERPARSLVALFARLRLLLELVDAARRLSVSFGLSLVAALGSNKNP